MKKHLFLFFLVQVFFVSCTSYEFEIYPSMSFDPYDHNSLNEFLIDSIEVYYYPWTIITRASIDIERSGKKIAVIKNKDTIDMIVRIVEGLSYNSEACVCNMEFRARAKLYGSYRLISDGEIYDSLEQFQFSFDRAGRPVDEINWRLFERSDKLIELLQLPPNK